MTTEGEADVFCEFYDFEELANLSDTAAPTETAPAPPESPSCALNTTLTEPVLHAEEAPTCSVTSEVKEELGESFTIESRTLDELAVDYQDCGTQSTAEADPLALSPMDIKVELLEADDTNCFDLRLPRIRDVPETVTDEKLCDNGLELADLKPPDGLTRCQIVIEEKVRLKKIRRSFIPCPICGFNAKNVQGLKIHSALKHTVRQRLSTDQFEVNCNNNIEETVDAKIETDRHDLRRSTVKPSRFVVEEEHRPPKALKGTILLKSLTVNYKGEIMVFSCTTCMYRTGRKNNMYRHFKTQHVKSASKAGTMNIFCNPSWVKKTEYMKILEYNKVNIKHRQPQNDEKVKPKKKVQQFDCFACEFTSGSRYVLEQHLKEKHVEYATETDLSDSKKVNGQEKHVGTNENKKIAGKRSLEKKSSTQVNRVHHHEIDSGSELNDKAILKLKETHFICDMCDFVTNYKCNMGRHFRAKHQSAVRSYKTRTVYRCNVCPYECKEAFNMKRHFKMKHGTTQITKSAVVKPVANSKVLPRTEKTRPVKSSNATVAGKRKRDAAEKDKPKKNNVKKQMLHSVGQTDRRWLPGKFSCSQCNFSTQFALSWKRHVREVHGDARTFKCPSCSQAFKRRETRNNHYLWLHVTILGTFVCSHCLFQNSVEDKVKKHILAEHKDRASVIMKK